jgi:hypothetical protein
MHDIKHHHIRFPLLHCASKVCPRSQFQNRNVFQSTTLLWRRRNVVIFDSFVVGRSRYYSRTFEPAAAVVMVGDRQLPGCCSVTPPPPSLSLSLSLSLSHSLTLCLPHSLSLSDSVACIKCCNLELCQNSTNTAACTHVVPSRPSKNDNRGTFYYLDSFGQPSTVSYIT